MTLMKALQKDPEFILQVHRHYIEAQSSGRLQSPLLLPVTLATTSSVDSNSHPQRDEVEYWDQTKFSSAFVGRLNIKYPSRNWVHVVVNSLKSVPRLD